MRNSKLEELQLEEPWPGSHAWAAQNAKHAYSVALTFSLHALSGGRGGGYRVFPQGHPSLVK